MPQLPPSRLENDLFAAASTRRPRRPEKSGERLFAIAQAEIPDGTDVVENLTELPLPGRTFVVTSVSAADNAPPVTLPSFIAGPENQLVAASFGRLLAEPPVNGHAHSAPLSSDPAGRHPSTPRLIAIHGPTGSGKTHLARGLVRCWQRRCGSESAEYLTTIDFRREFIAAIDSNTVKQFRQRLRSRQLLAFDGLDHLPRDQHLLAELRNTLDQFEETDKIILVTATLPIATLPNLSPDIRSRLAAGLVLQLAPPGTSARQRLATQTAAALGRLLPDEAACRLANNVRGTANDIFGAVLELCANAPAPRGDRTLPPDQTEPYLASLATRRPALHEIIAVVARYYRIPQRILKSGSRKQVTVLARATAIFLAREIAGCSYENIGRALGGRDHSTIMHSYRKILHDAQHDLATELTLEELRRIL
ncbi:MAG: DnaA/Hda family protein, partial [Planctomycetes bacterium]|nr:DnaA/Hda family protein [Planctomycetota bacterium]